MTIPFIPTNSNQGIQNIEVNGTGIPLIRGNNVNPIGVRNAYVADIRNVNVQDTRTWLVNPPQAVPPVVPVTVNAGTPIVNMPGCVKVHKENAKNPKNKNKMLVDDDPKGNTVLCDAGAPYFTAPNYDARSLSWETIYGDAPEVDSGVDTGEPPAPEIDTPEPPVTPPQTAEDIECPPPNARRIGDLNQAGTEKVKEYKLTPDGKICETIWEPIPFVEQYLPSAAVVTTTAGIAAVATTSALLAKPLADLLLKVVKPLIKKVIAKVKEKVLRQKPPVLSLRERLIQQRERNEAAKAARKLKGN